MSAYNEPKHGMRLRLSNPKSAPTDYSPLKFYRCHSKLHADDTHTDVWKCAFEPAHSTDNANSVFATCGGNSVCVIDAESGHVITKHYSKDPDEDFTSLAWTTVAKQYTSFNILAVAGRKFVLHLLHPDEPVCFAEHFFGKKSDSSWKESCTESLMFHPEQSNILFGAITTGKVLVWDIGEPHPPEYNSSLKLIYSLNAFSFSHALAFSTYCNMLLCGSQEGVVGWLFPRSSLHEKQNIKKLQFGFPSPNENLQPEDKYYVDSLEIIRDGKLVATKCALHGCIFIWDLEEAVQTGKKFLKPAQAKITCPMIVKPLHTLKWSDTDNFYMNIGINPRGNILGCGDDKGNLWIYNIDEILALQSQEHDCKNTIEWPHVQDEKSPKNKRKLPTSYGISDIVVNKVSFNYDANFLVAVTSTNTVCVWKRDV